MTQFDLPHIAARIYGTPQLVAETKFETILDSIAARIDTGEPLEPLAAREGDVPRTLDGGDMPAPDADGVATIQVRGTTVRRAGGLNALSGLTSYEALTASVASTLADPAVKGVMLEIDSFGGEAAGAFDAADDIARSIALHRKPVFAIANESALSAGYALAAVADALYLPRTGTVGSIGVVAAHRDRSVKDSAEGVKYSFIHAGDYKIDGNPHEPLPDDVRGRIQADVDQLYDLFIAHVVEHRPALLDASARATEARVYRGGDAVKAGLADAVGTLADARAALLREINRPRAVVRQRGRSAQTIQSKGRLMSDETENIAGGASLNPDAPAPEAAEDLPETDLAHNDTPEGASAPEAPVTAAPALNVAEEVAQATARCAEIAGIAAQAAGLGVTIDAVKAMQDGTSPDALRRAVMETAARNTEASSTCSAHAAPVKPKPSAGWDKAFNRQ